MALRRSALLLIILVSTLLWMPGIAIAQEPTETPLGPQVHIVQPGEDLFDLALRYNVTTEAIRVANGLADPPLILVGQALVIPIGANTLISPVTVEVGFGESLHTIAARHGLTQDALAAVNRIINPSMTYAGQNLVLPEPTHPVTDTSLQVIYPTERETLLQLAFRVRQNITALILLNDIGHLYTRLSGRPLAIFAQVVDDTNSLSQLPPPWHAFSLHPLPLENGHTGGLHIETTIPGTLRSTFMGSDLHVVSDGASHEALVGLHRYTIPGLYPLSLEFESVDGTTWYYVQNVMIVEGDYTSENLNLPPGVGDLLDPDLVREERLLVFDIVSDYTPPRYWDGLFLLPTMDDLTSGYGAVRSYNGGEPSGYHAGVDFGGPEGTPIHTAANGIVAEANPLVVRGNVVIINHGMGVYTGYFHLSEILVEEGQTVAAGQEIGRMGSTGLSTAAHLHWEMWVNETQVDPLQWAREPFP